MRRRLFLTACGVALAGSGLSARPDEPERELPLLAALAATVVPDPDPAAWERLAPRERLEAWWRALEPGRRTELAAALRRLDQEAGGRFAALAIERRAGIVRGLLERSNEFAQAFGELKGGIVVAFYGSPLGRARTGFIPTDQFRGYPEMLELARGKE